MRNACDKNNIPIRSVEIPMTYDAPFLRHVTSNKTYNFCIFSNFDNSVPIDLKIGTHIDLYTICHIKIAPIKITYFHGNQNHINIINHRALFKTLTAAYHPFILDGCPMKLRIEIPVHNAQCV